MCRRGVSGWGALPEAAPGSDVAVIGAGVVGLAVAHRLAGSGKRVVVVEKEKGPGMGVTAGQANVIHVIQLPFGSLKSKLARRGNHMYDDLCRELGVRLNRMPALLLVNRWLAVPVLLAAFAYVKLELGKEFRVSLMRGSSLRKAEPSLAMGVIGGLKVDGYGTVDVNELVSRLADASTARGVTFRFGCKVTSADAREEAVTLKTSCGEIRARVVVNAAGLYSDEVAAAFGVDLGRLEPGLGVMAVCSGLSLRCIVAPLPLGTGSKTKGGALIPATDGTTIVGPTLRVTQSKEDRAYTEEDMAQLTAKFAPLLREGWKTVRVYAGTRPLSPTRDFIIDYRPQKRVVNLVGIESPGLTAAPAIAEMVERMIAGSDQ